jgi:hypothetical protein
VAASGPDGVYTADVKAGRYRVWPSGRSLSHRTPPKFEPEHRDVSAHAGSMAHANFTVDIGLGRKAHAVGDDRSGRRFSDRAGHRQGDRAGPPTARGDRRLAAPGQRSGQRGGQSWRPGGSVDVQTDSNGSYQFTLDVGTVPGPLSLTAWARDANGALITHDTADASDDQTLGVAAIGTQPLDQFVPEYNLTAKSVGVPNISSDPNSIISAFENLTRMLGPFKGLYLRTRSGQRARRRHLSGGESTNSPARRLRGRRRRRPRAPAMGVDASLRRRDH